MKTETFSQRMMSCLESKKTDCCTITNKRLGVEANARYIPDPINRVDMWHVERYSRDWQTAGNSFLPAGRKIIMVTEKK